MDTFRLVTVSVRSGGLDRRADGDKGIGPDRGWQAEDGGDGEHQKWLVCYFERK